MSARRIVSMLAVAFAFAGAQPAQAQECPCNCYFSGDCEGGQFCDWGNLSIEDSCFWRQPKPQGSPGAGCTEDYGNWGQCDGICADSLAVTFFQNEDQQDLINGIGIWNEALTRAAETGGGFPVAELVGQVGSIQYGEPRMYDSMWRITVEVLTITRGTDFLTFPEAELFRSEDVRVKDLSRNRDLVTVGNLAISTLMAEIADEGAGLRFIERMEQRGLDAVLGDAQFNLLCPDQPNKLACLYGRIQDMADAIGRGGAEGGIAGGSGCNDGGLVGCDEDNNGDYRVNVDDLTNCILAWGPCVDCVEDCNSDNVVNVDDLVQIIQAWGHCPQP